MLAPGNLLVLIILHQSEHNVIHAVIHAMINGKPARVVEDNQREEKNTLRLRIIQYFWMQEKRHT